MKSHNELLLLVDQIFKDLSRFAVYHSLKRDLMTIRSRTEHEGMSFLTITLPQFCDDFHKSLDRGFIDSTCFRSFKKHGPIPAFLRGMVSLVFSENDGRLLNEPDINAISDIRQVTLMFKKIKVECTNERKINAINQFIQDEQDFIDHQINDTDINQFVLCSHAMWAPFVDSCQTRDWYGDLQHRHGPGATVDKLHGNAKYAMKRWYERLEPYFPLLSTLLPIGAYDSKELENVTLVPEDEESPVKVTLVPKTLKSPRIIAIEPACMQYAQQGLSHLLVRGLTDYSLTSGHLNFDDQTINQRLALKASRDQNSSTLDLSSASDRVPLSLAMSMFQWSPEIQNSILACRSRRATLPNGEVIHLRKFASMGSALCFPVEAMYFFTICVKAILDEQGLPYTLRNAFKASRGVYIFGDDIIVPSIYTAAVIDHLHRYNCKVGTNKSFWVGKFRESCGVDAYDGVDVTPTYIRTLPPNDRQTADCVISWVATSNLLYKKGYWCLSQYMYNHCESIIGKLPIVGPNSSAIGIHSFQRYVSYHRWNKKLQRPEVRAFVPAVAYRKDPIGGYHALAKCLSRPTVNTTPEVDKQHLQRSARHGVVKLKSRWTAPF